MAKAKRIFEVAKELGVTSKAIVEKCQAEKVPGITNHMSPVKLGLEQTIRQWFSDSGTAEEESTAVEVSDRVDLEKVRRASRRKLAGAAAATPVAGVAARARKATTDDQAQDASSDAESQSPSETGVAEPVAAKAPEAEPAADVAVASPEAAVAVAEGQAPQAAADVGAAPQADTTEAVAPVTEPAADSEAAAPAAAEAAVPVPQVLAPPVSNVKAMGRPNVPSRPDVVKPAGAQFTQPNKAVLRGPTVVRVDKPDALEPPRNRRPGGPQQGGNYGGGGGGNNFQDGGAGDPGTVPGITRSRGPARGKGAGAGTPGGADAAEAERNAKRNRRSLTARRGRSADSVPTGPGKYSEQDLIELDARLKSATGFVRQRRRDLRKRTPMAAAQTPANVGGKVEIAEPIFIKNLSAVTGIRSADIIKYLFTQRKVMANINSAIDSEAAMEICLEYDIDLVVREKKTGEQQIIEEFENREAIDIRPRPPIVAVLGHVDHGKTSLLDRIRKTDVASHEAGGITQHVGAARVTIRTGEGIDKTVVFLDTPGHEAFTSMRSRGANLTDIVVLVVAADDGVMPQTIESINHAKAAGVPVVVALNKIDRPDATDSNIQRIFGQLAEHGLNPVEWGGSTEVVKVSALQGTGIEDLVEVLDLQADILELKADFGGLARGMVIEAEMQEGRGPVARVMVEQGEMKVGDFVVIGRAFGRVRDMTDGRGTGIAIAGPATPLELSGIDMVPNAGDKFYVTQTLQKAEQTAQQFRDRERNEQLASQTKVTLDNFADQLQAGKTQELRVVLKADVHGSIDVLKKSLSEVGNKEVSVRVLHGAVGGITESDVLLADASDAIIVGFHVVIPPAVREIAEQRGVDVRLYRVIYDLINEVKLALEGMLAPETKEEAVGEAQVRETFRISKLGMIAGCLVTSGSVVRGGKVRIVRDGIVVADNRKIESVRRHKDDVREVRVGTECGIKIEGFDDMKGGDLLQVYKVTSIKRTLE